MAPPDSTEPPSFEALKVRGARKWLTDGPNSGGVEGLLSLGDQIWWFRADWTPAVYTPPMSAAEFLTRYGDRDARGYREFAIHLRARGSSLSGA